MRLSAPRCLAAALLAAALTHGPANAQQNPLARGADAVTLTTITGRWNGSNLEHRANCTAAQNNGNRGTYAEFVIGANTDGDLGIVQNGITGLTCNYVGKYRVEGANRSASGTYTCSDGKRGDFASKGIIVTDAALSIRMDIVLNTTETCVIDAVIGAARLP